MLNKYGIKATLNLNSDLNNFVWFYEDKPIKRFSLNSVKHLYDGHEVASHSLTHPYFSSLPIQEVIRQVKEDIKNLNSIFKRKTVGFAFPFHDQTEENIQTVKENVDLEYIRYSFLTNEYMPKDRYHIPINALYDDLDIYQRLEEFSNNDTKDGLFVIAGHSYEFEVKNDWVKIENLLIYLKNNKKIVVLTLKDAVNKIFGQKESAM